MRIRPLASAIGLCLCLAVTVEAAPTSVWEGTLEIPTYLLGVEDPNPPFPLVNHNRIYPYTMMDDLTDKREVKAYRAVYLENEYLKATILPELGGHLYSLFDKVTKREVFYRNNVVKYGLVALRGPYISGGIEFNFPNGHTTDTVSQVSFRLFHEPDGSATVVVGDTDQVSEMHWEVALTLRPGQARLEQRVTLFNSTPSTQLRWYWANAAVPATEDMQFIYPMREANPHSHTEIRTYPVWKGVDYSWYRQVRQMTSLFGLNVRRDFFGAYYHQREQGVVHVADYREVPGKKVWTWGVADDGLIWTDLLTDKDGPYNEIQSGRFQTQISQEFIPPAQVERWTEYWYPVAGLAGGFVEATSGLAINARLLPASAPAKEDTAEVLVSPAVTITGASVVLRIGDQVVREFKTVSFQPLVTRKFTAPIADAKAAEGKLQVEIIAADNKPLLRWSAASPIDGNPDFIPAAGVREAPQVSDEKLGVQELFEAAQTDEKENRQEAALKRYKEILKRDPVYVPALLKMAMKACSAADFAGAQDYAAKAMAINGIDPQVAYAFAVIQRAAGKWAEAQDLLRTSVRYGDSHGPAHAQLEMKELVNPLKPPGSPAPAYAQLGEIAIHQKEYARAQELLNNSLSYNPGDALVWSDLAVALRLSGKVSEGTQAVAKAARLMPLLPFALAEQWRTASAQSRESAMAKQAANTWRQCVGYSSQNYLEAGVWYRNLGDLASSDFILSATARDLPANQISPLVYYYLAANARDRNDTKQAEEYAAKAASASYEGVFPNRIEDAEVLREAINQNALDAHAAYFLGTFLFAHGRYDEALQNWSQALAKGFRYSVLYRNLGLHAWKVKNDPASAAGFFEEAIRLAPGDYRLYNNLDEIYAQLGANAKREMLFAGAPAAVLGRDTVRVHRALLLVEQRQFDNALGILTGHSFKPWEGGQIVRDVYVLANLEKGRVALAAKDYAAAERAFRVALEYPHNLGVGRPDKPNDEAVNYWLGEALSAQAKNLRRKRHGRLPRSKATLAGSRSITMPWHLVTLDRMTRPGRS